MGHPVVSLLLFLLCCFGLAAARNRKDVYYVDEESESGPYQPSEKWTQHQKNRRDVNRDTVTTTTHDDSRKIRRRAKRIPG
ncbi:unnamed protein product [Notodromas monacha]|uniref:Secreted protein n=1 Tax=Notodromas monacha TaxID=399045 RepID=A0A7R9BCZ0_9CRUS|nr:unnamed protein product [Notodromas monacha]CAG0913018.1 unnamed protein product [Notodromas monacha]